MHAAHLYSNSYKFTKLLELQKTIQVYSILIFYYNGFLCSHISLYLSYYATATVSELLAKWILIKFSISLRFKYLCFLYFFTFTKENKNKKGLWNDTYVRMLCSVYSSIRIVLLDYNDNLGL